MALIRPRNSNNDNTERVEQNNPLPHIRNPFLSKKLTGWGFFRVSLLLLSAVESIKHSHLLFNLHVGYDTKGDGRRRAKTLRSTLYENKEKCIA